MIIRSNHVFLRNFGQSFVGPPSIENHVNLRDEVFHSRPKGALIKVFRQVFKNHRFSFSNNREIKQRKK